MQASGIGVLDKVMAILRIVAVGPVGFRSLLEHVDITRSTLHRLCQGMEDLGLLRRNDNGDYTLGLALIGLGRAATDAFPLAGAAMPVLQRLQVETGESVQLFVRDDDERLCVAAVDSAHELRTTVPVGSRFPMSLGSAGRVLAGGVLDGRANRHGWLASVAERAEGVASVSAPVWDGMDVLAAVSVSGPIERVTRRPGQLFGDAVSAAARQIEELLAGGL